MHSAIINGVDLHYADDGPQGAPALVFANSLGTDLRLWDALIPHLPAGLRLVRYDKRGHGLSEETPGPYSIDLLADDAAGLIAHLGLVRPVFVGLSIGGLIGQSLALRHGGLAGLVISNSAARIGDADMWNARVQTVLDGGIATISTATMERWFSPGFCASAKVGLWRRMLERQPVAGYAACCQAIAAADYRDQVGALDLPVQVIGGGLDGATPPDLVRATAGLIPGAAYAQINGAGHLPCVETPADYAAILIQFLQRIGHV
ncbi:MAG: 3-oxoadipate enol-lactonase [Paracoccus sp. (in: a-proteobacteria)]|uniref:3-oxoadipate enol-lactonase n=1 Tax=Paracoccus sp. TaxID=267 RepID=UPI0026DF7B8C|nr:3-oxoadipate enol-lactonase [Paracoccus sp. (in: a-proteobacteria)]MDO5612692.1 3-oxoadipate enol-lactonase [Paracoccus sp. (in: a-proteobacteria)]